MNQKGLFNLKIRSNLKYYKMADMRTCTSCKENLPLTNFSEYGQKRRTICKNCYSAQTIRFKCVGKNCQEIVLRDRSFCENCKKKMKRSDKNGKN